MMSEYMERATKTNNPPIATQSLDVIDSFVKK